MFRVNFQGGLGELLVDGNREDYERFRQATDLALASASEVALPVQSVGVASVSQLIVRHGPPPNRVHCEESRIIFSIAPSLQEQFQSFIDFPSQGDLPETPIQYHHHFDGVADDGTRVAPDSLPVVFGLKKTVSGN